MGVFLELIIAKRFASKIPQYSRVEEKKKEERIHGSEQKIVRICSVISVAGGVKIPLIYTLKPWRFGISRSFYSKKYILLKQWRSENFTTTLYRWGSIVQCTVTKPK